MNMRTENRSACTRIINHHLKGVKGGRYFLMSDIKGAKQLYPLLYGFVFSDFFCSTSIHAELAAKLALRLRFSPASTQASANALAYVRTIVLPFLKKTRLLMNAVMLLSADLPLVSNEYDFIIFPSSFLFTF